MPKHINISSVYCILNIYNNKRYVGSSTIFSRRKSQHLHELRKNKHPNHCLQLDFNFFGEIAFRFFILEKIYTLDKDELISREQYWINKYNPEYNVYPIAGKYFPENDRQLGIEKRLNALRGRKQSQEEKDKRAHSLREYYKTHTIVVTSERRKHLSEINMGDKNPNFGLKRSPETLKKMSISRSKTIYPGFIAPDGTRYENIKNLTEFARKMKMNDFYFYGLKNRNKKSKFGWKIIK